MRQVAVISQTIRASHCHAYMNTGEAGQTIMTSNPSAFAGFEFAAQPQVIAVNPPPELLPTARLVSNRVFRSALAKARTGSRTGAWIEANVKRVARRLRNARGSASSGRRPQGELDDRTIRASAMFSKLEEEHDTTPIDRIVVFDVFDLPVALAFAEDHDIDVWVR